MHKAKGAFKSGGQAHAERFPGHPPLYVAAHNDVGSAELLVI